MHSHSLTFFVGAFHSKSTGDYIFHSLASLKKKKKKKKNGGLRDAGGLQGKMEKIEAIPEATGNGIAHQSNVL